MTWTILAILCPKWRAPWSPDLQETLAYAERLAERPDLAPWVSVNWGYCSGMPKVRGTMRLGTRFVYDLWVAEMRDDGPGDRGRSPLEAGLLVQDAFAISRAHLEAACRFEKHLRTAPRPHELFILTSGVGAARFRIEVPMWSWHRTGMSQERQPVARSWRPGVPWFYWQPDQTGPRRQRHKAKQAY